MVDASTDCGLDRLWLGLVHSAVQTDVIGAVVAAADHEQLGAELAAAVEAASADKDSGRYGQRGADRGGRRAGFRL